MIFLIRLIDNVPKGTPPIHVVEMVDGSIHKRRVVAVPIGGGAAAVHEGGVVGAAAAEAEAAVGAHGAVGFVEGDALGEKSFITVLVFLCR